jgi:hypothetical protein
MKTPRINKTKEEIKAEMERISNIAHMKDVVRKVFPLLTVPTIYDAQTTLNALVGFIKADIEEKTNALKLSNLEIDLSKEADSEIKTSMLAIIDLFKDEPAEELSATLDRLSQAFGQYGSMKFVKGPMTDISLVDILAE